MQATTCMMELWNGASNGHMPQADDTSSELDINIVSQNLRIEKELLSGLAQYDNHKIYGPWYLFTSL